MSSLMIVSVSDGRELFETVLANVGFFTCVNPLMDLKIASLVEDLVAKNLLAIFVPNYFGAYELLLVLFALLSWSKSLLLLLVNALSFEDGKILVESWNIHFIAVTSKVFWLEVFEVIYFVGEVLKLLE